MIGFRRLSCQVPWALLLANQLYEPDAVTVSTETVHMEIEMINSKENIDVESGKMYCNVM